MGWERLFRRRKFRECGIEGRIRRLERELAELAGELKHARSRHPIHIGHLRIDRVQVEKIVYENNIANLGIRSLEGTLNIGANYGSPGKPGEESGDSSPDRPAGPDGRPPRPAEPAVRIRPRSEQTKKPSS